MKTQSAPSACWNSPTARVTSASVNPGGVLIVIPLLHRHAREAGNPVLSDTARRDNRRNHSGCLCFTMHDPQSILRPELLETEQHGRIRQPGDRRRRPGPYLGKFVAPERRDVAAILQRMSLHTL